MLYCRERLSIPPSLFWKRFTPDTLSTKLKKLSTHQKKIKSKDQFTTILEQPVCIFCVLLFMFILCVRVCYSSRRALSGVLMKIGYY